MSKDLAAKLLAKPSTIAQLREAVVEAPKTLSAADRQKQLQKAIAELDPEKIERTREVLTRYVDSLVTLDPEHTGELSPAQAKALMEEDINRREIDDLLTARKATIKELVFNHLTETAAAAGAEAPEYTNGEVVVEELGHRFTREGAGPGKPSLNVPRLKKILTELVGEDNLHLYVETTYQPVDTVNEDAINQLIAGNPELVEHIREALDPGKPKKGSFYNRPVK